MSVSLFKKIYKKVFGRRTDSSNSVEALLNLKQRLKSEMSQYTSDIVSIGEYTYGKPIIRSWNKDTKLQIGKFCSIAKNVTFCLGGSIIPNGIVHILLVLYVTNIVILKGIQRRREILLLGMMSGLQVERQFCLG